MAVFITSWEAEKEGKEGREPQGGMRECAMPSEITRRGGLRTVADVCVCGTVKSKNKESD